MKTPCIKNSEYKSQPKTKKIPIVISAISHFRSPFIIITPSYPQIIFLWRAKFFLSVAARAWEYFKFLGGLLYWGVLISFLEKEATSFSSIMPSMTNHVNSKTVDGKIICFMCAC